MADIAVICAGPSVQTTWPGWERSHDINIAVNTASDYVPDDVLHWWAAGDLLNMPRNEVDVICKRFPPRPQLGVLINAGSTIPQPLSHCVVHVLRAYWPLAFNRRMFTGPCVGAFAASLRPNRITVYGCDLHGDGHACGVRIGEPGDVRWPIEAAAWRAIMEANPAIEFVFIGHRPGHLMRLANQFPDVARHYLGAARAEALLGATSRFGQQSAEAAQFKDPNLDGMVIDQCEPERVWVNGNLVPVAQAYAWRA